MLVPFAVPARARSSLPGPALGLTAPGNQPAPALQQPDVGRLDVVPGRHPVVLSTPLFNQHGVLDSAVVQGARLGREVEEGPGSYPERPA